MPFMLEILLASRSLWPVLCSSYEHSSCSLSPMCLIPAGAANRHCDGEFNPYRALGIYTAPEYRKYRLTVHKTWEFLIQSESVQNYPLVSPSLEYKLIILLGCVWISSANRWFGSKTAEQVPSALDRRMRRWVWKPVKEASNLASGPDQQWSTSTPTDGWSSRPTLCLFVFFKLDGFNIFRSAEKMAGVVDP